MVAMDMHERIFRSDQKRSLSKVNGHLLAMVLRL